MHLVVVLISSETRQSEAKVLQSIALSLSVTYELGAIMCLRVLVALCSEPSELGDAGDRPKREDTQDSRFFWILWRRPSQSQHTTHIHPRLSRPAARHYGAPILAWKLLVSVVDAYHQPCQCL